MEGSTTMVTTLVVVGTALAVVVTILAVVSFQLYCDGVIG